MKKIKLTQGLYALIDNEDYDRISQHKWCAKSTAIEGVFYAIRATKKEGGGQTTERMQRVIMGHPVDKDVDHQNRNTLDNRKGNLRLVTPTQNGQNKRKPIHNTSGYKGVTSNKSGWTARIKVNKKYLYLGTFVNPQKASLAYNQAAKKHFGEYAALN